MEVDIAESTLAIALAHYGTQPESQEIARKLLEGKVPILFCELLDESIFTLTTCLDAVNKYVEDNQKFKINKKETLDVCENLQKELMLELDKRDTMVAGSTRS